MNFLKYRKQIIFVITLATSLLSFDVLSPQYAAIVASAVAVVGSLVHYQVPDVPPTPKA